MSKLIQFWDNYYLQEKEQLENTSSSINGPSLNVGDNSNCIANNKEWILTDSPGLIEMIASFMTEPSSPFLDSTMNSKNELKNIPQYSHCNEENRKIRSSDYNNEKTYRILEIGCGTSRLCRSLLEYLESAPKPVSTDAIEATSKTSGGCSSQVQNYHVIATDASSICIEINKQRDADILNRGNSRDGKKENTFKVQNKSEYSMSKLEYQVLDVTCPIFKNDDDTNNQMLNSCSLSSLHGQVQSVDSSISKNVLYTGADLLCNQSLILDKGCLDTFLFRCPNRKSKNQPNLKNSDNETSSPRNENDDIIHSPLITTLLHNIHYMLKTNGGIYLCISPRAKIAALRDFNGFHSVKKIKIPVAPCTTDHSLSSLSQINNSQLILEKGDLEDRRKNPSNDNKSQQYVYIYVCYRNDKFNVKKDKTFKSVYDTAKEIRKAEQLMISNKLVTATTTFNTSTDTNSITSTTESNICSQCGCSFSQIRNGESIHGKGEKYWARKWQRHKIHCRQPNSPYNS